MGYNGNQSDLVAYLYGEMDGKEKELFEKYLLENPEARNELQKLQELSGFLGKVPDKEVIAPPIFVGDHRRRFFWNAPYFSTITGIAASLIIIILVGRFSGMQIRYANSQLNISFGPVSATHVAEKQSPALTPLEVQAMINSSLNQNNLALQATWDKTQDALDISIKNNLASNSAKLDQLVRKSSAASQEQVRQFVAGLQTENMQLVKNYFQLTSNEQKQYIESLLVDFAKYLQQQRNDDLQIVQTKLNSLQQNTDVFKQETEQILTSIISTVGNKESLGTKN